MQKGVHGQRLVKCQISDIFGYLHLEEKARKKMAMAESTRSQEIEECRGQVKTRNLVAVIRPLGYTLMTVEAIHFMQVTDMI